MPHSRVFVVYPPSVTLLRCVPSISHTSHYNPANNSKKNDFTMSPLLTSSSTISQRSLSHSTVPCRSLRRKHGVRSSNVEDGGSRATVWCFCTSLILTVEVRCHITARGMRHLNGIFKARPLLQALEHLQGAQVSLVAANW